MRFAKERWTHTIALLACWLAVGALAPASAADLDIGTLEGVYKRRFANGTVDGDKYQSEDILEIVRYRASSSAYIRMHLEFYNGHTCDIAGIAGVQGDALVYRSSEEHCELRLRVRKGMITSEDKDSQCRQFSCGMRGAYEGTAFPLSARRPIRYMQRLLQSEEYKGAVDEYAKTHTP